MPIFALLQQVPSGESLTSLLQVAAILGPGGVLAAGMFWFYRKDRLTSEKRHLELAGNFREIVQENTKAITSNTEVCRTLTDAVGRIKS